MFAINLTMLEDAAVGLEDGDAYWCLRTADRVGR
jgi:hypothetical protein